MAFQHGAFQSSGFQDVSPVADIGGVILDGGALKSLKKVEQSRDKWGRDLRRIIEDAFDDKTDIEIVATPQAERKQIAKAVYLEADTQGMATSMARIEALIAEYIRHEQEELEEEEAVVMLLLSQ